MEAVPGKGFPHCIEGYMFLSRLLASLEITDERLQTCRRWSLGTTLRRDLELEGIKNMVDLCSVWQAFPRASCVLGVQLLYKFFLTSSVSDFLSLNTQC